MAPRNLGRIVLLTCLGLGLLTGTAYLPAATENLVSSGDVWAYYNQDHAPLDDAAGYTWKEVPYDDTAWGQGPSQLGYGDGDEATVLSYGDDSGAKWPSYYFRKVVHIPDISKYTGMTLRLVRDDGAVVYVNGVEVWRANVPDGTLTFDTYLQDLDPSWAPVGGSDESTFFTHTFDPGLLVNGDNVIAVEVHQIHGTSSDISFDLELVGEFPDPLAPAVPVLVGPADGATGVSPAPTLEVTVDDPDSATVTAEFWGRSLASTPSPFEIIVLPDTQYYVDSLNGGEPAMFTAQTQWIADNIAGRNIVFVAHEGDITQNGTTGEYDLAQESLSRIDPGLPLLPSPSGDPLVPYGLLRGNHDSSSTNYNAYFPYTRYEGLSWYGGHYPSNANDNSFALISAGGVDFVILSLSYNPDSSEIDWARGVLQAHSDRIAILVTHSYLDTSGALTTDGGTAIYDGLVNTPDVQNVRIVLCGHRHGEVVRTETINGRTVHQILADYQDYGSGGNGYLRIMRFVPAEGRIDVQTYSPYVDAWYTDADSEFTLDFPMVSHDLIGSQTVAPGQNAAVVWDNLSAQTSYEWFVKVIDDTGRVTVGPLWGFTTLANLYAPTAPDPADGATGVDINAVLTWTAAAGVAYHDVFLGPEGQQAQQVGADLTEASCIPPASLDADTVYTWKVVEKDGSGVVLADGPWWTFRTAAAPGAATLVGPADGAIDVPPDVVLEWSAGTDAEMHDVWLGTAADNLVCVSSSQTETFYDPDLDYATSYYWRIDEIGPGGKTVGPVWQFTTADGPLPTTATAVTPTPGATDVPVDVVLEWTAGTDPGDGGNPVTWHELYLWKAGEAPPSGYLNTGTEYATTYDPGDLDYSTTYNWRVDESGVYGVTTGDVWTFTTQAPPPPGAADNPIPADGAEVDLTGIVLTWTAGADAESHDVYFGTDYAQVDSGDHDSTAFRGNQTETSYALGTLIHNQVYYWRIDEVNSGGTTAGAVWSFTARDVIAPQFVGYVPQVPGETLTHTSAVVKVETDEPTTVLVEYGLDPTLENPVSVFDGDEITYHDVLLGPLEPGTSYYYQVTATDPYGNATTSQVLSFTTNSNTPPVAVDDTAATVMGVATTVNVVANDSDGDGDGLTVTGVDAASAAGGTMTILSATDVEYTPPTGFVGSDSFAYIVSDGFDTAQATVTITVSEAYTDYAAGGEFLGQGTVTGTYVDTWDADGVAEICEEVLTNNNRNGKSRLEHTWTVDVGPGYGAMLTILAYRTSADPADDFVFAWSPDNQNYTDMFTVQTDDGGMYQEHTYALPSDVSGTVYIRLSDTDASKRELVCGVVFVDYLAIRVNDVPPPPDTTPPAAPSGLAATAGDAQVSLDWNDNTESDLAEYVVYRSLDGVDYQAVASGVVDSAYVDSGLTNDTTYYYVVTAVDTSGNESAASGPVSATPQAGIAQDISVGGIAMELSRAGKNWKAYATIALNRVVANAAVACDWYLDGQLLASGQTAVTDASGQAVSQSPPVKAKSGHVFRIVITDVTLAGYMYVPSVETAEVTVP